ncbi:TMPIT-like protein [Dictyocaulus viviparus]|uniref:TMPIT-like protein n=1 Tax=Dictyocaulus viviparus TaxID=29172 RepID=A0A0D8XM98_DICVI|nr:TMPIT-like protein [Dictyocaulus viviparus]
MIAFNEINRFIEKSHTVQDNHVEYIKKLSELTKIQECCFKTVKHCKYILENFRDSLDKVQRNTSENVDVETISRIRNEMTDAYAKLKELEAELPVKNNGFYLSLILGTNLNLSLLSKNDKYRYKKDYETFKWRVTLAIIVCVLLSLLFPLRVMDSLANFLMVWYYCTLTIRENILTINGSRIKGWWVMHHYFSCVLSGIVLTWKDGECYQSFRQQFIYFVLYIGFLQMLQVFALCCMFFGLAVGNIVTTSIVILKKFRTTGSYNYIVGLTRKYSIRPDEKEE